MSFPRPNLKANWTASKEEVEQTEPSCEDKGSYWPGVNKLVTNVSVACSEETGKPWLVQTCMTYDEKCGKWSEACEGIYELPVIFKAPVGDEVVTLPSFDGPPLEVLDADGEAIELYSGGEVSPDMSGSIFCVNGELCYLPGNINFPNIPNEVQCGGPAPTADSGVELWISNGIPKVLNDQGIWVQTTPFGA